MRGCDYGDAISDELCWSTDRIDQSFGIGVAMFRNLPYRYWCCLDVDDGEGGEVITYVSSA